MLGVGMAVPVGAEVIAAGACVCDATTLGAGSSSPSSSEQAKTESVERRKARRIAGRTA